MSPLESLNATGIYEPESLTTTQISEVNLYLSQCRVFIDAHVPQTARNRGEDMVDREEDLRFRNTECYCVLSDYVTTAPYLLERALGFTDLAADYLGIDPPVLYSSNAFWTRPGVAPTRPDIQEFHEDKDDVKFLAMFVYLTDVLTPEDGPHQLAGPDGKVRVVYGPAGTIFLADTSRPHRGGKPQVKERGLAWFRWGVSWQPPAGQWDQIQPITASLLGARYPSDPRLQASLRLLAE